MIEGFTFDDVLIIPKYSDIPSRKLISLKTKFSRRIELNIPIVSANMDTVTESEMAIAMAVEGGIGIIHRFMPIERQMEEVRRVKRAENILIADPITIFKDATLGEALEVMRKNRITGILVCDAKNYLEGILTSRDVRFKKDLDLKVKNIMTARARLVTAKKGVSLKRAVQILDEHKIEKLPLVDKRGRLAGLITASDFKKISQHQNAAKDKNGRFLVGAAIGVKDGAERAEKLVKAGADALIIDIAHGHHKSAIDLLKNLKRKFKKTDIIAGNVATPQGVTDLIKAGADAVKVGIGPGAACSTRIVAGAGMPQLTAIMEAKKVAKDIPIIADGGIKNSGDAAKAIAAGASTIMVGNLLAGTKESPGEYFIENGAAVKIYRGLASRDASLDRQSVDKNSERQDREPEGISTKVVYKGEAKKIIGALIDGLQSGMSYAGARAIKEFWQKAEFVKITENGSKESLPRPNQ
ncbi:MAG: IMP dehydrogenase [Candidatus Harrisonbacteria bacterium RIFCSPHIGHO2_01_FULL_44_13]|uniref:Inosine-5'-monophosphate dehydrogenase n=1 Tax=Candidatus Harrisonbacteria bacterium RIFCSPLOWO2_01_FULL_44_18 TaxID=1798407 RepID=A0A1G1ZN01_9BACT|nr:MAG: IMP dehydrogenase [Candidatus Harrisonbacteria bacterium RIFCSPHIGHO2_01_FULL_44_13]OGY65921.1 MAG: IMP dehydrogenase [Candidatus Harrisonbacteria bacterium RIFCSPLOWO2_01_FULL_44_18]